MGRSLGKALGKHLYQRDFLPDHLTPDDISSLVAVACLAHDIGNPPFGHSGEKAIQQWAERNKSGLESHVGHSNFTDFTMFEGNAQSFRILARLWDRERAGGARLTLASYASLVKYPQGSSTKLDSNHCARKKYNFMQDDIKIAEDIFNALKIKSHGSFCFNRHPLAYIMEAADDITYNIIDLEDALKAKLIPKKSYRDLLQPLLPENSRVKCHEMSVSEIRARAIGELVKVTMMAACRNLGEIYQGSFALSLTDAIKDIYPCFHSAFLELKREARQKVYVDERVLQIEYAGIKVIGGLLDAFAEALPIDTSEAGNITHSGRKLLELFPEKFMLLDLKKIETPKTLTKGERLTNLSPYQRLLAITDYISGMTDSYALNLHRILTGNQVP